MKPTVETWHRFRRLTAHSHCLVFEAAIALVLTYLGLRVLGLRRWKPVINRLGQRPDRRLRASDSVVFGTARAIALFQGAAARHLFVRTNCLEQSLVLWWLLQRRGIASQLCLGARKERGRFEAHAWVEVAGIVLNDASLQHLHFARFNEPIASLEVETP